MLDELPELATTPDTGNCEPDDWEPILELLAPKAHTVHVKITSFDPDGVQTLPRRDGSTKPQNLRESFRHLASAGFRGQLTYAYTAREADEREAARKGIDYMRELSAAVR
jgi:hypothetical protein